MRTAMAMLAVLGLAGTSGADPSPANRLVVGVYDTLGLASRPLARAMEDARRILARADVDVEWHVCTTRDAARPDCSGLLDPRELVVRLVRLRHDGVVPNALGVSLIDQRTGAGTLATVFIDRIESLAHDGKTDTWRMTGRVIAHEIGHLLLGSDAHTDTGLMRRLWTLRDLKRNRAQDWMFSRAQREQLRAGRAT